MIALLAAQCDYLGPRSLEDSLTLMTLDPRREGLRSRLLAARAETLALVDSLQPEELEREAVEGGWSPRDTLAHLAAAELGHQWVIQRLLAGESPARAGFDLDAFNNAEVAARQDRNITEIMQELADTRGETLAILDVVGPQDWDRAGSHPGGFDTTVEAVFRVIAIHERRHLKEIRSILAQ